MFLSSKIDRKVTNDLGSLYYGAFDFLTGRALTWPAPCGDSDQTVAFLKTLRRRFQGRPMLILWDGASYHRSERIKAYLQQINGALPEEERPIQCLQFAPNAPQQNPIEDIAILYEL